MQHTNLNVDIIDIVFKNKNKEYGAYYLRKTYSKRLIQSMIAVIGLVVFILLSYFIDSNVKSKSRVLEVKEVKLADIQDIPQDLQPPPPPPPQEQPKVEVKKFTELLLEKKEDLKPTEIKPDINLDELVDANIGKVDVEGVKTTTLAAPTTSDENYVFTEVSDPAGPEGGFPAWTKYLRRNLNASVGVDNGAPAGRYTVIVRFIVERDGRITDVKTVGKKNGYGMEEEAMRVFREGPPWRPGQQNGKVVRSYFTQNVTFVVEVD